MFVNFALNKDPHLRAALMTAMRQVARLDYVAIAQHFNGQFADEDPPIMTSAGFVQAYMDRADRSMSMSMSVAPSVSASMSISRSRSMAGRSAGRKRRRRKRDNIVIDSVDDIRDLSRRELDIVISYIRDKYGVHICRHHDTCTRQNDVIAAWKEDWCLPVVVVGPA